MSDSKIPLNEIIQQLEAEGFVLVHRKKYKFTDKFYEALLGIRQGITRTESGELVVCEPKLPLNMPVKAYNWPDAYMRFIMDAKVPRKIQTTSGSYNANQYSEEGMKAFRKALETEHIDYDLLLKSTQLYYASATGAKQKIGNYIAEGTWRTEYMTLKEAAEAGVDELHDHITNETKGGHNGGYEGFG